MCEVRKTSDKEIDNNRNSTKTCKSSSKEQKKIMYLMHMCQCICEVYEIKIQTPIEETERTSQREIERENTRDDSTLRTIVHRAVYRSTTSNCCNIRKFSIPDCMLCFILHWVFCYAYASAEIRSPSHLNQSRYNHIYMKICHFS